MRIGVKRLFGGIKISDKIFLTKYLSLMLRVGTDLLSAVNILIADFGKPSVRNFLIEVRDNLVAGRPFYQAFAKYPQNFSAVFVSLIKAAEESGNLQQTFENLSASLGRDAALRNRVRSASIYPIILLVVSFGLFGFISVFALPKVSNIFEQGNIEPPLFSRIVFIFGLFFTNHIWSVLGSIAILLFVGIYFFRKVAAGRMMFSRIMSRMPFIKSIYRDMAVQRFAANLSSLMRAGLPIVQALELTADTLGVEDFRASILRISREGLAKGLTLGDAFRRETIFPRVVANLVSISEKAGHIEEILDTLSDFYTENIETNIKSLVAFLEPILLLVMGGLVALLALSIIIPIYQLTTQV